MGQELITAVALVLVIEGILPFLSPNLLRRMMFQVVQQNNRTLRITGLVTMLAGLILLYLVRH
ncbi:DUF2065 domain-containing protein [Nitrococcus mobilis]|uniref:DUF2065 domain-containing protein n=1 Tax=Nitrococcus mobilis Nb-231 TaxID=314278 RepID=A4BLP8_9GAMM|nr:DUF2065 domain-containing protein [Nitrococcus mobilis]EAR23236.1 hypothetical protein NB231_15488 [Nitrococcus mobilis Nb-231]